jgi:hypothetical protein
MELHYKNVSVKMMMFIFTIKFEFLALGIIVHYEAQSTFFHGASNQIFILHHSSHIGLFVIVIFPIKLFTKF